MGNTCGEFPEKCKKVWCDVEHSSKVKRYRFGAWALSPRLIEKSRSLSRPVQLRYVMKSDTVVVVTWEPSLAVVS
ncbi:hypothetical protein PV327_007616 [Microctonus hyperodae]|uniref:Uncharacterized protein n=1 Tax=Microctonus hyperodae TaxID=165561 RepID=A0AA39FZW1_MICHY|nr:hypothetical protein PV327_007616 [Microctonus hyperodae]